MPDRQVIAGIDYSLRGPAICVWDSDRVQSSSIFRFEDCQHYYLTDTLKYAETFLGNIHGTLFRGYTCEVQRYMNLADWAIMKVKDCSQVQLEDYALGAKGRVFHIGENTGVLKMGLYLAHKPLRVIGPTVLKKYAAGKGNADKDRMHAAFKEQTGIDLQAEIMPKSSKVTNPVSDIVDAFFICRHLWDSLRNENRAS